MPYPYPGVFAIDPDNPSNVAVEAELTIFDPADSSRAPILLVDSGGLPVPNPMTTNNKGFVGAFYADLDEVGWVAGELVGLIQSFSGIRNAALKAADQANTAAADAAESRIAAENAANLVEAPSDQVIGQLASTPGTETYGAVWAQVQETLRQISVNVADLGAVGDDTTDSYAIIQGALDNYRYVYVPGGDFVTSAELKVPSDTIVAGQGKGISRIRLADGAPRAANVLTNAGNDRTAHSTPDRNIHLRGITFDGNAPGKQQTGSTEGFASGSCVAFACVENSSVTDCHFTRGYLHGLDISASVYIEEGNMLANPVGPSRFVVVRDCTADWAQQDDAFTTHASGDILFENCRADRIVPGAPTMNYSSQGFEIDDASFRVAMRNCYARGYAKGFQVKGHTTNRPARDVVLDNCVAEGNNYNFEIAHVNPSTYPAGAGRLARNVQLISCTSIAPALALADQYTERRALVIIGYDGVTLTNFTMTGGTRNGVRISEGASNVTFETVAVSDTQTDTENASQGLFHCFGSVGKNIIFRNISVHTPITSHVITHISGTYFTVEHVQALGLGSGYVVNASAFGAGAVIRDVTGSGFTAPIRVGTGPAAGTDAARVTVPPLETLWAGSASAAAQVLGGAGAPAVAAPVGSLYLRTDGGAGTSFYVKESGTGSTGWIAK